jgi:hypothetical protein
VGVHPCDVDLLAGKVLLFLFLAPTLWFIEVPYLEWNNRMHSGAFKKSSVFMLRY